MKKKERIKIQKKIKEITISIEKYLIETVNDYGSLIPDFKDAMPNIFKNKISFNCFFSEDRRHIMIIFNEGGSSSLFNLFISKGNIFDNLDSSGKWKNWHKGIVVNNARYFTGNRLVFNNLVPYDVYGNDTLITIIGNEFELPDGIIKKIEFGIIFSYDLFDEILNDIKENIKVEIHARWDYYRKNNKKLLSTSENREDLKKNYDTLLSNMKILFFGSNIAEHKIDSFIQENPIILEVGLHIKPLPFLSQQKLENIVREKFEQNMRPDLICQDLNNQWKIVDYKRAKHIIKFPNTARGNVIAEVSALKTQLKNYRDYFSEEKHRILFKEETGFDIPSKPKTIGVIGNVSDTERHLFEDSIEDDPNWVNIVTYNDLYRRFETFYNKFKLN